MNSSVYSQTIRIKPIATTVLLLLVFSTILPTVSGNATVLDRRYTFSKLDEYWTTSIDRNPPNSQWFAKLVEEGDMYNPVVDVTPGEREDGDDDFPLEFPGITGEDPEAPDVSRKLHGFPVLAIPRAHAQKLYKRLAQLEMYLSRYKYFHQDSADTADQIILLTKRHKSASMEMYLSHLLLYFAESTFENKCLRIRRVRDIGERSLQSLQKEDLLEDWEPLYEIYVAGKEKFGGDLLKEMACGVKPPRTRGEMEKIIKARVRVLIFKEVNKKIDETLILLRQASSNFQQLVNQMDVTIQTKEIFQLEQDLGNVRANLLMVKDDLLKAAELIGKLKNVDLSQLDNPADLQEFKEAKEMMENMAGAILSVLEGMLKLTNISKDPAMVSQVKKCEGLDASYRNIDFSLNTASLKNKIVPRYESCLKAVERLVTPYRKPTAYKKLMAEFAKHVHHLSQTILGNTN